VRGRCHEPLGDSTRPDPPSPHGHPLDLHAAPRCRAPFSLGVPGLFAPSRCSASLPGKLFGTHPEVVSKLFPCSNLPTHLRTTSSCQNMRFFSAPPKSPLPPPEHPPSPPLAPPGSLASWRQPHPCATLPLLPPSTFHAFARGHGGDSGCSERGEELMAPRNLCGRSPERLLTRAAQIRKAALRSSVLSPSKSGCSERGEELMAPRNRCGRSPERLLTRAAQIPWARALCAPCVALFPLSTFHFPLATPPEPPRGDRCTSFEHSPGG
jgi:hypothetical protein